MTAIERIKANKEKTKIDYRNSLRAEYLTAKEVLEKNEQQALSSAIDGLVEYYSQEGREKSELVMRADEGAFVSGHYGIGSKQIGKIDFVTDAAKSQYNLANDGSRKAVWEFMVNTLMPKLQEEGFKTKVIDTQICEISVCL